MLRKFAVAEFVEATASPVPTILAYDPDSAQFTIGAHAWKIASGLRPVIQDYKNAIGEPDAMFEGRYQPRGVSVMPMGTSAFQCGAGFLATNAYDDIRSERAPVVPQLVGL
jgi:hypothetical protein